jgi:hypothetical protein
VTALAPQDIASTPVNPLRDEAAAQEGVGTLVSAFRGGRRGQFIEDLFEEIEGEFVERGEAGGLLLDCGELTSTELDWLGGRTGRGADDLRLMSTGGEGKGEEGRRGG